jgi:hypothetical protein
MNVVTTVSMVTLDALEAQSIERDAFMQGPATHLLLPLAAKSETTTILQPSAQRETDRTPHQETDADPTLHLCVPVSRFFADVG